MQSFLGRISFLKKRGFNALKGSFFKKSHKKVFTEIYTSNAWGSEETVSGPGSEYKRANNIITQLPEIFRKYNIKTFIDAPCGDFNYMKHVDLQAIQYLGVDIVEDLITSNQRRYGKANIGFICSDMTKAVLPKSDVIISRDSFIHFSFADTAKALKNFKKSGAKFLLTNTYPDTTSNVNIISGGWRPINLLLPPYNFPKPIFSIVDTVTAEFGEKNLSLYELKEVTFD